MAQETVDSGIGDRRRRVPVTTERPYTGIAHLKHENGNAIGTGFLVKHGGRIFLVTAAHCLWDRIKEAFRAEIHISLGRNGEYHPFGTITKKSVDFEVPREYKERGDSQYDYGIICLDKEKHMLDECCAFDLEPQTDEYIKSQDLYMSGYPGTPEERKDGVPGWPPDTQWEIKLTTVTVNERSLQYQDATTPGNSGSPVYEIKGDRYVAHGVHINGIDKNRESNEAVRIDVDALMKLVKKAYRHKKKGLHCHQIRSDASGSSSSRSSTLDSFTSGSSSSRSSTLGSPISGSPLQDPPLQDSRPQDPPLQDPQHQDPPLQDPQHQDPLLQDPQHQDPPLQDPQPQDPPLQDPQHQDPPLQDPQHQDPPLQDPQPQDPLLQDPSPQQNRKAPKDNHSEPPKLSWFKRLCKTVKSWFCRACETVKRWFR